MSVSEQVQDHGFPPHQLSWSAFDAIARGYAHPDEVKRLRQAERSRRLLLLRALSDKLAKEPDLVGTLSPADEAWELLGRAECAAPEAWERLLAHPYTGAWAGYVTRLLRDQITGVCPTWMHVGYLHSLAAASAILARIPFTIRIPVWDGGAMLPTIGMARLDVDAAYSVAEVCGDHDKVTISDDRCVVPLPRNHFDDAPNWWCIRTLAIQAGGRDLSVRLDDLDPYRGLYEPVQPQRLSRAEVTGWRDQLRAAWELLGRHLPDLAAGLPTGLDSLVPRPAVPFRNLSASTGEAFGSAIIAKPADPAALAATLVHEFHHNLLSGLLHLIPLYETDPKERFYTLWRDDPRPISGVLSGVHAFLGVTAFWRELARSVDGPPDCRASFEFAYWRTGLWRTLRALSGDPSLTQAGQRFVDGIVERLTPWLAEPVSTEMSGLAESAAADHLAGWRIRYVRPRGETVNAYAKSWLAGQPWPGGVEPDARVLPTPVPDGSWCGARTDLVRAGLTAHARSLPESWPVVPGVTEADVAYVSGRYDEAISGYRAELAEDADRPESWVGLGLAMSSHSPSSAGARALLDCPELVRAVHRAIRGRTGMSPAPDELAEWIGRSVC